MNNFINYFLYFEPFRAIGLYAKERIDTIYLEELVDNEVPYSNVMINVRIA